MTREVFFFISYAENMVGRLVPDLFLFLKRLYIRYKQVVCSFISLCFSSPRISIQQKQTAENCRLLIWRYTRFWFFRKESRTSFSSVFCVWFFNKKVFHVIFYYLTKFHGLIAFTSWDIEQYVYCNCLVTRLWHHKFWN